LGSFTEPIEVQTSFLFHFFLSLNNIYKNILYYFTLSNYQDIFMLKKLLTASLLFTSFSYAFINLEPPVIGEKEGLDGEISFGAKFNSGNSDTLSLGMSGKGQYSKENWLIYAIAAYSYGESNDIKDTNDGVAHLRYIHEIADTPYDYELFLQAEFNEFQGIKSRNLAGANIRRDFANLPFDKFYVGLGLFYSYMEPDVVTHIDPIYERVKINTYISFLKKVNDVFSVTYLGYYQPNVEDFLDYRIFQIVQFTTEITENIGLSFDILHKYNATPYHAIEETDIRSTINLKYKFK
jgi:putative salt-induced outer membrane protein